MATTQRRQKGEAPAAILVASVAVMLLLGGLAGWLFLFDDGEPGDTGNPATTGGSGSSANHERVHSPDPGSINDDGETGPGTEVDRQSQEGPVEIDGRTLYLIDGQVRDAERDAPASGCEVYLIPGSEGDPLQALTNHQLHRVRDSEGWFQIKADAPGEYHVVVRSDYYQDLVQRVHVPLADPLALELVRGTWIHGTVRSSQGGPLADVTVWLQRPRLESTPAVIARTPTDDEGRFAFYKVEPGTYRLAVGNPSAPLVVKKDLRLEPGQRLEPVLTLPSTSTLLVFVTGDDTRPLEGARVTLTNSKDEVVRTALTDAEGLCRIDPVQEGSHRLTIQAENHTVLEEQIHLTTHTAETTLRRRLRR